MEQVAHIVVVKVQVFSVCQLNIVYPEDNLFLPLQPIAIAAVEPLHFLHFVSSLAILTMLVPPPTLRAITCLFGLSVTTSRRKGTIVSRAAELL